MFSDHNPDSEADGALGALLISGMTFLILATGAVVGGYL
jgi:hypothetical protein